MNHTEINFDRFREERIGLGEAVFCLQKTSDQIETILTEIGVSDRPILLTRLSEEKYSALSELQRNHLNYDTKSETAFYCFSQVSLEQPQIMVVAAGTSDARVAREVLRTLEFNGHSANAILDVGVAGMWRLLNRMDEIRTYPVIISVAGMEASLPTVLGGMIPGLLIAVPTSTGYGVSRNGETALAASLSSCAPGIVVCNIDNGYGAACAAIRVLSVARKIDQSLYAQGD